MSEAQVEYENSIDDDAIRADEAQRGQTMVRHRLQQQLMMATLSGQRVIAVIIFISLALLFCLFLIRYFPTERRLGASKAFSVADAEVEGTGRWQSEVTSPQPVKKSSSSENNSVVAEIQRKRQKLLSEVCAKYFQSDNKVGSRNLISTVVNKEKKFIYCRVSKVASRSWRKTIGQGLGAPKSMSYQDIVQKYMPPINNYRRSQRRQMLDKYFKFMFVRHPFKRVVSAWWEMIEKDYSKPEAGNFARVARLIQRRYRAPGSRGGKPTFSEFVTYLTDPRTSRPFNRHWMPFHEMCRPCQVRYDFIGHLETLSQDADYVLNKIGLRNVKMLYKNSLPKNTSSLVASKVTTLTQDQIKKLTDVYRLDFLLFGYSTEL